MAGRTSFDMLRTGLSADGRTQAISLTMAMEGELETLARGPDQRPERPCGLVELAEGNDVPETC